MTATDALVLKFQYNLQCYSALPLFPVPFLWMSLRNQHACKK